MKKLLEVCGDWEGSRIRTWIFKSIVIRKHTYQSVFHLEGRVEEPWISPLRSDQVIAILTEV